jgi:hypothetical protein
MSEPPRPPPTNMLQAVGNVAESVIGGLKAQPLALALIILNVLGIGGGMWFLGQLSARQHERAMILIERCIPGQGSGKIDWPNVTGWPPPAS